MDDGVDFNRPLKEVFEGGGKFLVPEDVDRKGTKGPGKKDSGMFYNPAMEIDRNISVLLLSAKIERRDPRILDALCASGIRGIRYVREIPLLAKCSPQVVLNDINEYSCQLAERNALYNHLFPGKNFEVSCSKAQSMLSRERFDVVDIDPYGSAVPFLDSALNGVKHGGVVCLTATDTATACGTYQSTCVRRYQAKGIRNHLCHEAGLRIIVGHAVKRAAEQDTALEPLLAYWSDHYFRMFFAVKRSRPKASSLLKKIALGSYILETGEVEEIEWRPLEQSKTQGGDLRKNNGIFFGPYWKGSILFHETVKDMKRFIDTGWSENIGMLKQTTRLLDLWMEESDMPPFFKDTNDIGKYSGKVPKLENMIKQLREAGFKASRTHFSPTGIKTDASLENMAEIYEAKA